MSALTVDVTGWRVLADPADRGREADWSNGPPPAGSRAAHVPGCLQLSYPGHHGVVWYWARIPMASCAGNEQLVLHFERVFYLADVWVDGEHVCRHEATSAFEVDVTRWAGSHPLLVVRVLDPTMSRIDGMVLPEVPAGNAADEDAYTPGRGYNYGGITGPVVLVRRPDADIRDVHVVPEATTGSITVSFDVSGRIHDGVRWSCEVTAGATVLARVEGVTSGPIAQRIGCVLTVDDAHPWSPQDPYLYDVVVTALLPVADGHATRTHRIRTGFRTFAVDPDGYFTLNGRRILVRSTHTGNHVPAGLSPREQAALLRRDLINARAVGLNMVRFIASRATPEQLDLCDELGLLVYEECPASWPFGYGPDSDRRFTTELLDTVRRDRNHPSVVVWGLLNETRDGPAFRHAVASLQDVREMDDSRLVVLSSGRWDADLSIGSVSNPGVATWQHLWGSERPHAPVTDEHQAVLGYLDEVGDRHFYPTVPHDESTRDRLVGMGAGEPGPVFLSEYGIGSLFHVTAELTGLGLSGARLDMAEPVLISEMNRQYLADFARFGLESVFAFPEDLLDASYAAHARHRSLGLTLIRSNPRLVGHNVTGMLDHAVSGEGLWSFADRVLKTGVVDAVGDGFAPLRWCICVDRTYSEVGEPVGVTVTLADEGVLPVGRHSARLSLVGPDGPCLRHDFDVEVPGEPASRLVHPGTRLTLPAQLSAGRYEVRLHLDDAVPRARTAALVRVDPLPPAVVSDSIVVVGPDSGLADWLAGRGLHAGTDLSGPTDTILLTADAETDQWPRIRELVSGGATLVVLDAATCVAGPAWQHDPLVRLDVDSTTDWLYHTETVGLPHRILRATGGAGLLDWETYGCTIPSTRLRSSTDPDEIAIVQIGIGMPVAGGYVSGYAVAAWSVGAGRVIVNTLRLLPELHREAAAGRLLHSILTWATGSDHA